MKKFYIQPNRNEMNLIDVDKNTCVTNSTNGCKLEIDKLSEDRAYKNTVLTTSMLNGWNQIGFSNNTRNTLVLDKANTSFQEVYHLNQIRYNNRNRKLENSTQREFYSELSRIRAEECIKFGAFPRRLNMITDQDCRACYLEINTAPTNVTYSSLKHLKRFYPCPYHGENSTRAKGGGRCLNFASKNLKEILEHCYQYHGMVMSN